MQISICGKRWNLRFIPRDRRLDHLAKCDPPDSPNKEIVIQGGQSQLDELDCLIHEMAHAANWNLDEGHVTQWATDVARTLIRLGWKKSS